MDDIKNMTRGIGFALLYIIITIIVPYLTFTFIKDLSIAGLDLSLEQAQYENIVFWVVAFGFLISGCAFFAYSSPSKSIRRAVFSLIQVILNCFYIWSYKFSGATEIEFVIVSYGSVFINLQQMIMIYLGIYLFTILLRIYDIADFSINRFIIREEKGAKILQKEVK